MEKILFFSSIGILFPILFSSSIGILFPIHFFGIEHKSGNVSLKIYWLAKSFVTNVTFVIFYSLMKSVNMSIEY